MDQEERQYKQELLEVKELMDNFPAAYHNMERELQNLLKSYYFADRSISVDDVMEYRKKILDRDEKVAQKAREALVELRAEVAKIKEEKANK